LNSNKFLKISDIYIDLISVELLIFILRLSLVIFVGLLLLRLRLNVSRLPLWQGRHGLPAELGEARLLASDARSAVLLETGIKLAVWGTLEHSRDAVAIIELRLRSSSFDFVVPQVGHVQRAVNLCDATLSLVQVCQAVVVG